MGVISFRIWVVWYLFFECIDFRPGRDFINVRGLLIQGGDYIYIYICLHPTNINTTTTHDDNNNDNNDNDIR